ncbi:hypothetical protein Ddye_027082 [Dipteronia dyeriana]|uniref:Reverse transcriptase zinc-binding domain-containing protein n=1 Tax=Dipteronia dyeriana TaxID=168575 RepID=A0AAD9WR15_9ROSI|nr:hypothetical protein Ddye_027082 [Dipteronia dyeriana]
MHLVKWETLCQNKCNGGLGIGSILAKDKGLLVRWAWRFDKEDSPLWKRVICAKYGVPVSSLIWDWSGGPSSSFFVKAMGSLYEEGSKLALLLKDGLWVVMGRGDKARLWTDITVDGMTLKQACPTKISLACNKSDTIGWSFCLDGLFSIKSFRKGLESSHIGVPSIFKSIWQGVCPPKIEIFVWHLLQGRVTVKKVLRSFGVILVSSIECPRCEKNRKVFKDVEASLLKALDMVRFRVALWFKNLGKGSIDPVTLILLDIEGRCTDMSKVRLSKVGKWIPPGPDTFKFNVDRAARGSLAIVAEMQAIVRACVICVSKSELIGNWEHAQLIFDIWSLLGSMAQATIEFSSRDTNSEADVLAKKGAEGGGDVLFWNLP